MIFVPKKEDCLVWNETEDGIYILYFVDGNDKRELPIQFLWSKTPKMNEKDEVYYEMDYDPFYLTVEQCMHEMVLDCPLSACSGKPQLRYNKIIDKWYCNCPSSAICTKNNDEDELNEMLAIYQKQYDYENKQTDSTDGSLSNYPQPSGGNAPSCPPHYPRRSHHFGKGTKRECCRSLERVKNSLLGIPHFPSRLASGSELCGYRAKLCQKLQQLSAE